MTDYPQMPKGTCYQSSRIMAAMYPELSYVEGWMVFTDEDGADIITPSGVPMAIEHAWNVTPDGEIVDSTRDVRFDDLPRRYEPGEVRRG